MAFSEVFPLEVVKRNALQIYQVQLTNWGNNGPGADPNSLVSPIFEFSLAGLAIDPESLITSVIVRPVQNGILNPSGVSQPNDIIINKDQPFLGRLTFPRQRPFNGRWGLVAFQGDRYTGFMTGQDGLAANFGGNVPQFVRPDLRVIMYIDAAPPPAMVPVRAPRRVGYAASGGTVMAPATVTIEPISGRRFVRVTCSPVTGPAYTFQVRGITSGSSPNSPPAAINVEFAGLAPDIVTGATGAAGAVQSALIRDPTCAWLHVLSIGPGAPDAGQVVIDMFD